MNKVNVLCCVVLLVVGVACESKKPNKTHTPTSNHLSLDGIDIVSISMPNVEGVPTKDALSKALMDRVNDEKNIVFEAKKQPSSQLRFYLKAQPVPRTHMVVLAWGCDVVAERIGAPLGATGKYIRQVVSKEKQNRVQSIGAVPVVTSLAKTVDMATTDCVKSLAEQWSVRQAQDGSVAALLNASLSSEAAVLALQRVRQLNQREDAKHVQVLLEHKHPQVILLSMSVLVHFKDQSADARMVEAAARMRRQNYKTNDYLASLFQIGQLNATQGRKYLETIINSHINAEITQAAREALKAQ